MEMKPILSSMEQKWDIGVIGNEQIQMEIKNKLRSWQDLVYPFDMLWALLKCPMSFLIVWGYKCNQALLWVLVIMTTQLES
jgi:hypothetical protein